MVTESRGDGHDAVFVVGALEETIMLRGMRYHPCDIEATIQRCHKKIAEWWVPIARALLWGERAGKFEPTLLRPFDPADTTFISYLYFHIVEFLIDFPARYLRGPIFW